MIDQLYAQELNNSDLDIALLNTARRILYTDFSLYKDGGGFKYAYSDRKSKTPIIERDAKLLQRIMNDPDLSLAKEYVDSLYKGSIFDKYTKALNALDVARTIPVEYENFVLCGGVIIGNNVDIFLLDQYNELELPDIHEIFLQNLQLKLNAEINCTVVLKMQDWMYPITGLHYLSEGSLYLKILKDEKEQLILSLMNSY
jgi:hypothetical protein